MEGVIRIKDPVQGIGTVQVFPQHCPDAGGKLFFVDIDDTLFKLRIEANAVWLSGESACSVPSELITLVCKLL